MPTAEKKLTVTTFKNKYENDQSIYLKRSHNNPTLIQTVCEERVHSQLRTCDDCDWINGDYAITICDDLIFDSNFEEPMKLTLENLNKYCMNVTKPSCEFKNVCRGFVFSKKILQSRESRGRIVKTNTQYRTAESTKQLYKDRKDPSHASIIENLDMSVKKLSLQLLSRSFEKCADSYPETDMYLDASKKLSEYFFNIFSLKESFLIRKPYCIQIVKKYFSYHDILFGCFDVPTLMLISIKNIFGEKIYDIIAFSKEEIFTSYFEYGVMRNQKNLLKYMEFQNCDDFRKIEVLKTLCFYGR